MTNTPRLGRLAETEMDWSYTELVALGENNQDIQRVKAEKIQIPKSLSHIYLQLN